MTDSGDVEAAHVTCLASGVGDNRSQWLQRADPFADTSGVEVVSRGPTVIVRPSWRSAELSQAVAYRCLLVAVMVGPSSLSFTIAGRGSDWTRDPVIRLVDAPLFVIAALLLVPVLRRASSAVACLIASRRTVAPIELAFLALTLMVAWVGLSWAMNPRAIGALMVLRLIAVLAIVDLINRSTVTQLGMVIKTMVGLVVFESLLCVAQLIVDGQVGFGVLGELADPFNRTGPWRAPTGTSYYPYPLSAVALLTLGLGLWAVDRGFIGRRWAFASAVAAGVLVGSGYSVVGAAIVAAIAVAFLVRRVSFRRVRFRCSAGIALVMFVVAFGVTAGALDEGWRWKGERSASTDAAVASSGRSGQLEVGLAMAKRWPVLGIGAGNFAVVREAHHEFDAVSPDAQITHSMPVLLAVEAGFPALGLFGLSLGLLAWRRLRNVAVIGASMSGYVVGDLMHWYSGFGLLFLGVWLGFLMVSPDDASARWPRPALWTS